MACLGQVGHTGHMPVSHSSPPHSSPYGPVDAAKKLGVSPRTVRRLTQRQAISHCRIGGQIRFTDQDIDEYLKRSRVSMTD